MTRSNIIKIVFELTRHFINFDLKHLKTTNHCIKYLHVIKFLIIRSLAVELGFGQMFKSDPRVGQIRQPNPRVGQPEPEETEPVTYNFLGFGQKSLSKPASWTEILVQPED
jgi:hypothetical protein